MSSDAELLRRSRAGQKDAFAGLVERYQNLVCAVTFGATGDRELAADLAQDTFVAAWTSLPGLRDESRFRSWLCGIARNVVGKAKRGWSPAVDDVSSTVPDPRPAADETLEQAQSDALLREILEGMDETYREPLVLYYWEGRSTKEVAARLGLSVSAVEQRLSRGRRKIKAEVEDRVDRALQSAKPDARFAGLVLAALPTVPVAPGGTTRWARPAAALAGLAALGLAGSLAFGNTEVPDSTPTPTTAAVTDDGEAPLEARTQTVPSVATRPNQPPSASDTRRVDPDSGSDEGAIAETLEIEQYPNRVVVNLRGGSSTMDEAQRDHLRAGGALPRTKDGPITDLPLRTIRGTVIDAQGQPVAGAAVVAGGRLGRGRIHGVDHELTGQAGAMTDARGKFSFEGPTDPVVVTAAAGGDGFTAPAVVTAGDADVELELVVAGTGSLEGQLVLDGAPVEGYVVLSSSEDVETPRIVSEHRTDEGGMFRADSLPPGRYRLFAQSGSAGVDDDAGDRGPTTWIDVELRAGEVVQQDVALQRGITVEFRATTPGRLAYYAFIGVELESWETARSLLDDPNVGGGTVVSTPDDDEAFGVVEGLPHDTLTVCAVRPRPLFETTSYAECKVLPKPEAADATLSVTFDPPAVE